MTRQRKQELYDMWDSMDAKMTIDSNNRISQIYEDKGIGLAELAKKKASPTKLNMTKKAGSFSLS